MFLLFFAENIGIMRKMRISVNYADPHRRILSDAMAIVEIEAENGHFQPSAWGFLTMKHSRRFANDVALALREKILAGMDFRVGNRL